jgi:short-subunit dehydrogenase
MKNTVLITGASSGIGYELAKIHASKADNLVLVARNSEKLNELKIELEKQFGIEVFNIIKDLSLPNAAQEVYNETHAQKIEINYLINNAGFGDFGAFKNTNPKKELAMLRLNIEALTQFCKLYVHDMVKVGAGKIMNIASTAAFQPGPDMAVYYATKAYVLHFSEAIAEELKKDNITVTTLCPGATESGFSTVASLENSNLFKDKNLPSSKEVAQYAYKAMMKGKGVAIHGVMNYLMANSVRLTPRNVVLKVVKYIQRERK